ncbi:hypothetical protein MTO96_050894 [Rhipicephalus appendiculatus]
MVKSQAGVGEVAVVPGSPWGKAPPVVGVYGVTAAFLWKGPGAPGPRSRISANGQASPGRRTRAAGPVGSEAAGPRGSKGSQAAVVTMTGAR